MKLQIATLPLARSRLAATSRTGPDAAPSDIEMDQAVTDMLNADHNVQRAYHHPLGDTIFVYIGYYGAEGGWFTSGIARVERAESHRFEVFA